MKEEILKLKGYIKALAAEQKHEKSLLRNNHQTLHKEFGVYPSDLMVSTQGRAAKITAALNMYNELRGKEYQHLYKDPNRNWILDYAKRLVEEDLAALEKGVAA